MAATAAGAGAGVAGKTFLITGATDGIGLHTATRLASLSSAQNPTALILHGRDRARLDRAAAAVAASSPAAVAVRTQLCDLATGDLRALGEAVARDVTEIGLPLTVIHNAGVYATEREMVTPANDGRGGNGASFERTWQTNVLAPFALQHALLKALGWRRTKTGKLEPSASSPAPILERVVVTSSLSAQHGAIDFDNLQGEKRWSAHSAYSLSKACNQAFAVRLGELLSGGDDDGGSGNGGGAGDNANAKTSKPGVFSLDPGTVNTKMLLAGWGPIGLEVADADDTLWLATAPASALAASGGYFVGRRRARLVPAASDRATVDRLWALWREQTGCDELF